MPQLGCLLSSRSCLSRLAETSSSYFFATRAHNSFEEVRSLLERSQSSWPPCPYDEGDIDQAAVWQAGVNLTSYQGGIGRECHLKTQHTGRLTRATMIDVQGAELLETASNNVLILAAGAHFLIPLQDDQLMTQPGWNVALTTPLTTWPDVFSVSARCAHTFDVSKQGGRLTGAKCSSSWQFSREKKSSGLVFTRETPGNEVLLPFVLRTFVESLFRRDARFFGGGDDDHETNLRAYARLG